MGSCPSQITFHFNGKWERSYLSEEAANVLRTNPVRKAIVAGVFLNDLMPNASMSVMSLGSLDRVQGTLSQEQFWKLAELFRDQARAPDPELLLKLKEKLERYAEGSGAELPDFTLREYILTGPSRFVILGTSSSSVGEFLTAGLFHYTAFCIVSVQIGIPKRYEIEALLEALHPVEIHSSVSPN